MAEGTSDMVEVPSDQQAWSRQTSESHSSLMCSNISNLCLHFNYYAFLESKKRAKWVNWKSKIGRYIEHKRKAK